METKWLTATPEQQKKIEKWVNSLSQKNADLLELLVKEVREQEAVGFIAQVENSEWYKVMQKDCKTINASFSLVKAKSFRLI